MVVLVMALNEKSVDHQAITHIPKETLMCETSDGDPFNSQEVRLVRLSATEA